MKCILRGVLGAGGWGMGGGGRQALAQYKDEHDPLKVTNLLSTVLTNFFALPWYPSEALLLLSIYITRFDLEGRAFVLAAPVLDND